MFRAHVLIVRRAKLYYTVSGIITPIGGRPVHRLREDWMESVHRTATYRCDDIRDCIIQFCPPDDEHMCSKHVGAWNKLIIKFSASRWWILINKYIEMHGQQNIKKKKIRHVVKITFGFSRENIFECPSSFSFWRQIPVYISLLHMTGTNMHQTSVAEEIRVFWSDFVGVP